MNVIKLTFLFEKKNGNIILRHLKIRSVRAIIWVPRRSPPAPPTRSGWCARGRRLRSGGKGTTRKRGKVETDKNAHCPTRVDVICITF